MNTGDQLWIGHEQARRVETEKGWLYQEDGSQSFATYLFLKCCALPDLDSFIERLEEEEAPAGKELRERRTLAYKAFCALKHDAVDRHIEWIINRKREIERSEAVTPILRRTAGFNRAGRGEGKLKKLMRAELKELAKIGRPINGKGKVSKDELWEACKASKKATKQAFEFYTTSVWTPDSGDVKRTTFGTYLSQLRKEFK